MICTPIHTSTRDDRRGAEQDADNESPGIYLDVNLNVDLDVCDVLIYRLYLM